MLLNKTKLSILLSSILFSFHALAIENSSTTSSEQAEEPIERIEVEDRSPNFYLHQFRKERDAFYDHYNALVGEDSDLRIKCGKRKPEWAPVTLRKRDYCEPQFVYNLDARETQTQLTFLNVHDVNGGLRQGVAPNSVRAALKKKKREMTRLMTKLVNENPDLKAKFESYNEAEAEYRANQ